MPEVTVGTLVVFIIIFIALILFVTEPVSVDVTALGIVVTLIMLGPWTGISPRDGVSGFANPATITILAMMILSEGVRRTGIIQRLEEIVTSYTGDNVHKQLGATIGIVGPLSGIINNTAAVAILLPMVSDLAHENGTSPSKLLLPLSYASMAGGMLTLIGTSTNLLASTIASQLATDYPSLHAFSMFEFTQLGLIVFLVGAVYLLTIGYWLAPSHVTPRSKFETTDKEEFLTEVVIGGESPLIDMTIQEALQQVEFEGNVTQLVRKNKYYREPRLSMTIQSGDTFTIRLTEDALRTLHDVKGIEFVPEVTPPGGLDALAPGQTLVEIVITAGSDLVSETIETSRFQEQYQAGVLAIRRGGKIAKKTFE
jgi:Na+/H+ antiporter NhaD and related arsenite permeases